MFQKQIKTSSSHCGKDDNLQRGKKLNEVHKHARSFYLSKHSLRPKKTKKERDLHFKFFSEDKHSTWYGHNNKLSEEKLR